MKVEAIAHTDVKGKVQHYIKFTSGSQEPVLINVGIKTYTSVTELLKQAELPLPEVMKEVSKEQHEKINKQKEK